MAGQGIKPSEAFRLIMEVIRPTLIGQGFTLHEEREHTEAFGSRYAIFVSGDEGIRLEWDGKERWFVLEHAPDSVYSKHPPWIDLQLARWGDELTREDVCQIAEEFNNQLSDPPELPDVHPAHKSDSDDS